MTPMIRPRLVAAAIALAASLAGTSGPAHAGGAGGPSTSPSTATSTAAHDFDRPAFSADARGDITTIGNVTTTCDPGYQNELWSADESAAACHGATSGGTGLERYDGAPMPPINNRLAMAFVDVDGDAATFSSSTSRLHLPSGASVLWAGLHWNAATDVPQAAQLYGSTYEEAPPDASRRFEVRLSTPAGEAVELDASPADGARTDTWDDTNPGGTTTYGAFVDVTDLVRRAGGGDYTVADVQSCRGFGGCFGSWSLTVAFAHRSLPPRNLVVWHGWQLTSPAVDDGTQAFTVSGTTPPPRGPVHARIGVVQADGDRGLGPDSLEISSPSSPAWAPFTTIDRPLAPGEQDWFNSTVTTFGARRPDSDAQPNFLANLDQDIALVEDSTVIANADDSFSFRVHTEGTESLYSQVVHAAVDLYAPEIAIEKSVLPTGPVRSGDTVTWTLDVTNAGIDPVRHAVVTDPLPPRLAFVAGSIRYVAGGPAAILGPKTDAPGDDQAEWDATTRRLTLRLGAGADATAGGTMGIAPADDGSHHLTITFATTVEAPPGSTVANEASANGEGRALQDGFGPLTTTDAADATVELAPEADLGIAKDDGGAVIRKVGDRFTYTLTVTNAGPSPASGVTITDRLDPRLRFASSPDGCRLAGGAVTCPIGDLAAGASAVRHVEVEVLALPGAGKAIPNVASVSGDAPDPDCTPATPAARCNHDDEATPQPAVDLGISKDDGGAMVRTVGDRFTYRLVATNAGPDDATGVTIEDRLDPHLAFVGSGSCAASSRTVRCPIGDLPAGGRRSVAFEVRVVHLPPPGEQIPNVAWVHGDEPDPDCTPATPSARCNHDDEHTPRVVVSRGAAPPSVPPAGTLPRTGADLLGTAVAGLAATGSGAIALGLRRRRGRQRR